MKKFLFLLMAITLISLPAYCGIVQGGVEKQSMLSRNRVVDSSSKAPIDGAKITLPQKNYQTYTDHEGKFSLDADVNGQTVMSVEKPGYKPFSVTIDKQLADKPIILGIEKSTPKDITIDTNMFHLGDNNFSDLSANSRDFQVQAIGPYYSKNFLVPSLPQGTNANLIIGSIIGIDTKMAKSMGQNKINRAYSSPPEVYFNGNKIAELQLNGDGQKIKIPHNLIRQNQQNEVTIKTGRNLMQTAYVDYDDIEFMNLSIEVH